jgi:hypothetical protein
MMIESDDDSRLSRSDSTARLTVRGQDKMKIVICEDDNFIDIAVSEWTSASLPTPRMLHLEIAVQSHGFSGQGQAWIDTPSLRYFIAQLKQLKANREGSAEIASILPGQLWLRISVIDSFGQTELTGKLSQLEHMLEFSFLFCQSNLANLIDSFQAFLLR